MSNEGNPDPEQMAKELAALRKQVEESKAALGQRDRVAWKAAALAEFPLAATMEELVSGDSEEAVKASAKAIHAKLESFQKATQETKEAELIERVGQQAYGAPTAAAGGAPVNPRGSRDQQFINEMMGKIGSREAYTKQDMDRFAQIVFGSIGYRAIAGKLPDDALAGQRSR